MNWKKISWLAFSIYLLEIILGLIEGSTDIGSGLFPGISRLYAFRVALFVTCSIAFAFYTVKNPRKPLAHASLALLLEVFVATAVMVAPYPWSGSTPVWMFVVLDWFVLGSALVVGILLGITINHFATRKADA